MEEIKRNHIVYKIGEGVVSPLGFSTETLFEALRDGKSEARYYEDLFGLPEPFFGSLLDEQHLNDAFSALTDFGTAGYTKVEKAAIVAASQAIAEANIDAAREDVLFILSTTKGNVELLEENPFEPERLYLWHTAELIARFFDNPNPPMVVSNACISGCAAQIAACRQLQYHGYKYAVVIGAEMLSKFVISGFQSFKALSKERCKPFGADRCGLNLGEAAAAIVYTLDEAGTTLPDGTLIVEHGAINNDANHISGPSRTGEGLLLSLTKATAGIDPRRLAFINAHGTATPYNDDMESMAISRAGLQSVPVNSLKGYMGHTLGAAGVIETIVSACALREQVVLKTFGTNEIGTAAEVNVCRKTQPTQGDCFVKLISGFGGSNAAMTFSIHKEEGKSNREKITLAKDLSIKVISSCQIDNNEVVVNGNEFLKRQAGSNWLNDIYRAIGIAYPKFFKMDNLCKAGFSAAELLLKDQDFDRENKKSDWAVVLTNSASSLDDDRRYQQTIADAGNYYPSPAIFVYTLANIVTGEIAIRHKISGESSFYLFREFTEEKMQEIVRQTFLANPELTHILYGWVDVDGENIDVRLRLAIAK